MVVGVLTLDLAIRGNRSLKGKRQILKGLLERIKHRYNVSAAEVDHLDDWQRALVGISTVSPSRQSANSALDHIVEVVRAAPWVEIIQYRLEFL